MGFKDAMKQDKARRRELFEQREARRKATLSRNLDRSEKVGQRVREAIEGDPRPQPQTPAPVRNPRPFGGFGDATQPIWDYLPHPILLIPGAIVFIIVFVLVLTVIL